MKVFIDKKVNLTLLNSPTDENKTTATGTV